MRRQILMLTMLGVVLLLVAVALLPLSVAAQETSASATAVLMNPNGDVLGVVTAMPLGDGLLMQVSGEGLPPGFHGFHVHETGACDPDTDPPFDSAGGHLNPTDANHPDHAGDLPALYVTEGGLAGLAAVSERLTLDMLLDEDGSAIIVHENPDNYAHIPERYGDPDEETLDSGDSGSRLACGVFEQDNAEAES